MSGKVGPEAIGSNAGGVLRSFLERLERLAEERKQLGEDTRQVLLEAKVNGFDPKVIRAILADRKRDAEEFAEFKSLKAAYEEAIGM